MKRLSKAFLVGTAVGFTAYLTYAYAYFAEFQTIGLPFVDFTFKVSPNEFFYYGLTIAALINILCFYAGEFIVKQKVSTTSFFKREKSKLSVYAWTVSLGGAINLFLASIISVFIFTNNEEGLNSQGYLPLVLIAMALIVFWIIWLPMILAKNK